MLKTVMFRIAYALGMLYWWLLLSHFNKLPKSWQEAMASNKCSAMCQLTQNKKGGLLVYSICDEKDPKYDVADHFMNIMDKDSFMIFDGFGNVIFSEAEDDKFHIGDKIQLGERKYTIVQIEENFEDFGIKTFKDLKERYYKHLSEI